MLSKGQLKGLIRDKSPILAKVKSKMAAPIEMIEGAVGGALTPKSGLKCASIKTSKSSKSSHTIRKLEFEAAKAKHRLRMERIEAEQELLEKQLEYEKALAEEMEDDNLSQKLGSSDEELIDNTNYAEEPFDRQSPTPSGRSGQVVETRPTPAQTETNGLEKAMIGAFNALEARLSKLSPSPQADLFLRRQNTDRKLPPFDGNPEDYLHFITQYNETAVYGRYSNLENMTRIRDALEGDALAAVGAMMLSPDNLGKVLETLELRFGRPEIIIRAMLEKARNHRAIREDDFQGLIEFSTKVATLVTSMETMNAPYHMHNPEVLDALVGKLPPRLKVEWATVVFESRGVAGLKAFEEWLHTKARIVSLVHIPDWKPPMKEQEKKNVRNAGKKKSSSLLFVSEGPQTPKKQDSPSSKKAESKYSSEEKCILCKADHRLSECERFKRMTVKERWFKVTRNRLCFVCLTKTGHMSTDCKEKACDKDGCTLLHHELLHKTSVRANPSSSPKSSSQDKTETETVTLNTVHNSCTILGRVLLKLVQVVLTGPKGKKTTWALLDEASSVTLLDESLAKELGLSGRKDTLRLSWTDGKSKQEMASEVVDMKIQGMNGTTEYELKSVHSIPNLELPTQSISTKKCKWDWDQVRDVDIPTYENVKPSLLIGQDNGRLIVSRQVIDGKGNGPILSRTLLGWVIHGNAGLTRNRVDIDSTLHASSTERTECVLHIHQENEDDLHQMVKGYFKTEEFGVNLPTNSTHKKSDERAKKILDTTAQKDGQRWKVGLLWKEDDIILPESRTTALRRLENLKRKLTKDPALAKEYQEKIDDLLKKGYARELSAEEASKTEDKTWYLPHFGIVNPNKQVRKLRIVFDAASKSHGTSLNDALLTGPDLLNSLVGTIFKFRERRVAVCGDIREMFNQVVIRREDSCAQRFLWYPDGFDSRPRTFEMNVMIFGANSSPYVAQEIKNRNARQFQETHPEAVRAVVQKHYMDDYLDSLDTTQEALQRVREVKTIHENGGFEMRNWLSNEKEIVQEMSDESLLVGQRKLKDDMTSSEEKILGLTWDPERDVLTFACSFKRLDGDLIHGRRTPTKREVLSILMKIYDPLGLLIPFTTQCKVLLQDIWRSKIDWDDELTDTLFQKWKRWTTMLKKVQTISVPRCYATEYDEATKRELHIFCDASENSFAAVGFLRTITKDKIRCQIIMGKSRVSPLKPLSIPRLELQAAVMGTRLKETILKEHDLTIEETILWSDSKTVLRWIRADARVFKQFVSHRLGEILESTEVGDWRWVPSAENVADDATRNGSDIDKRWIQGPPFLYLPRDQWPQERSDEKIEESPDEPEMKSDRVYLTVENSDQEFDKIDSKKFSSWLRLIRVTGWVLRFIENCVKGRKKEPKNVDPELRVAELDRAEELWSRLTQEECFPLELKTLKNEKEVPKSSRLYCLSPKIDEKGLLRLGGRIARAPGVPDSVKEPVILPPESHYTKLLVMHYHTKAGHHGRERVLNDLRQRFWILKMRATVRRAWSDCQLCKNSRAIPKPTMMGSLPEERIQSHVRPFESTGMDFFGPIPVKVGRKREKRYGVLFTCLSVRAVHLEIAHSLTTDSCIMAIRRMAARRGYPKRIFSDNGTNMKGAEREIAESLRELKENDIAAKLAINGTDWYFNPPSAPHMGGVWERLVRSVKTAMTGILKERVVTDEVLQTVMTEAENIVNGRPLTHVSLDSCDDEALTPNHFLIGKTDASLPTPGCFTDRDTIDLRKQWRTSQRLIDIFWARWLRGYLPTLARRTKWHAKTDPMKEGDLVIVADGNMPRNLWLRGVITKVFPGSDGVTRVVEVKTKLGTYRRPVHKLCLLDVRPEEK